MSGSNFQEVINLDDDDQQAPVAPKGSVGINYSLFPKLYSMLNKKKPKQEEKVVENIIPSIIKNDNTVNEVCAVVPILMPQKKVSESQLNNSANQGNSLFEMVQREMLLVEECFETLVPVQAPKSTAIPNQTIQPHNQQSVKQPDNDMGSLQPIEQVLVGQASIEGPEVVNLQDQYIRQEKKIQIYCEDQGPNVFPSSQNVVQQAQHPVQPNKQMEIQAAVEQNPINQVPTINVSQKPLQNEDISLTKFLSIPQITKILMTLLPDMSNAIEAMNDMEILDIYKNVQAELPEGQLQKFIKQLYPDLCFNLDQTQNKQANSSQIVRQIEVQDACEINPAWSEIEIMRYFKSLPFQKLRVSMKKYFHYEDDHFSQMNYDDLLDILNQAIAEIQKKSESIEQKPQQSNQLCPQQVAEPTQNQLFHQNQEQNSLPSQENAVIEAQKIKILQMKKFLLENIQNLTPQILQTIKDNYIKMLYDDAINGKLSRVQMAQKIETYSHQIMEKSIQKFPHLQMQINKVSKSQMDDLMSQFINKNRKDNQNDTIQIVDQIRQQPPPQIQQMNFSSEYQQNRQQPHQQQENFITNKQKRSYDAMMNQNIHNNQNINYNSKRLKIKDLRERLIQRLPDLKDNIMALDDSEIQKVYNDSIQKNRQNYTVKRNKDSQSKPVILMKDKKPQIINKPQCSKNNQFQNAKVYQLNNVQKKKKTKTIVLIHTEEQSDEEMDESSKYKKTDQGIEKKTSCECWQKVTLGQLIKKLTEIAQKRN